MEKDMKKEELKEGHYWIQFKQPDWATGKLLPIRVGRFTKDSFADGTPFYEWYQVGDERVIEHEEITVIAFIEEPK